ncbi:FtsX-like permease family protein [Streptomyces sp. NPDC021093]|uniref:FtsX-like permease family protein n=1 Tax=Streptomyces sp. NPDC021093 TaxID=3365112 RepID=UPI00379304E6
MSNRAVAPWVRTRLRAAPGGAVALGVLVLITAFLASAFPRALDRAQDTGLRHEITSAPAAQRVLQAVSPAPENMTSPEDRERALAPEALGAVLDTLVKAPAEPLRAVREGSAYGVRASKSLTATDKWLPRLSPMPPEFTVTAKSDLARHSRFVEGRAPVYKGRAAAGTVLDLEAAVSTATARTLGLKVGSVVHLNAMNTGATTGNTARVKITGILAPRAPESTYWSVARLLHQPEVLYPTPEDARWWSTLLLAPEAGPALFHLDPEPETFWEVSPRTDRLTAPDTQGLISAVASLESGPGATALRERLGRPLSVSTDLEKLVASFEATRSAVVPVVAVAAFGVGTVAAVVLLMTGALAGARRAAELSLVRARGGSVRGLMWRLWAELAVVVLPAAALGWLASHLLLPDARPSWPALAAAAVALLASAGLPVRAALTHLRPSVHGERTDVASARPSRRRTVAELTLVALMVGAVVALRRRGTDGAVDQLVSAAPVLVGTVASFVLVRLYPLPLRMVARPMALRRGAVGFLSAARAGRSQATATLPLLALLLALTTAAFGGSVLAGVADSRDRAATVQVGADARLQNDLAGFDGRAVAAVGKVPGVREVSAVGVDTMITLPDGKSEVSLVAVDPESYARLSRGTDNGGFAPAALNPSSGSGTKGKVFPVLASPETAARLGNGPAVDLRSARYGDFTTRVAGTLPSTPALREGEFMVISTAALPHFKPSSLMLTATVPGALDRKALQGAAGGGAAVHLWAEEREKFVSRPFQQGAERIYTTAVAAGAGFAVLAVLLSLLQAAPERRALLTRLRTMGLTRGQGRRLLVLESLPQALLAACGGALVGWAAIQLLAPDIDLGVLALAAKAQIPGSAPVLLRTDVWSLLVPALAVVGIAAGVAAIQAWWSTRLTTTTELRAGDAR